MTKRQRVLRVLLERSTATRFDLERLAHDHCPNSTIAELRADGLVIHSRLVSVPGFGGATAHIAEYRLDEASRSRAVELAGHSPSWRPGGEAA